MVDMFVNKMCYYCLKENCSQKIEMFKDRNGTTYKCLEYVKNKTKIVPYQEPLIVTAEREYVTKKEK